MDFLKRSDPNPGLHPDTRCPHPFSELAQTTAVNLIGTDFRLTLFGYCFFFIKTEKNSLEMNQISKLSPVQSHFKLLDNL